MSTETEETHDPTLTQLFQDQLDDQRRTKAEFNQMFADNQTRLGRVLDDAAKQRTRITGPDVSELMQLLSENAMLTPNVLQYAKALLGRIQAVVAKELSSPQE